ncbi:hypothetical protein ACMFER_21670 [Pseudomonas aeruginosa]|uniref:hypothetical protein n=1 Tax=Pseudomonas aeruginosa TaxID=287 RepID=UPI003CFD2DD0
MLAVLAFLLTGRYRKNGLIGRSLIALSSLSIVFAGSLKVSLITGMPRPGRTAARRTGSPHGAIGSAKSELRLATSTAYLAATTGLLIATTPQA